MDFINKTSFCAAPFFHLDWLGIEALVVVVKSQWGQWGQWPAKRVVERAREDDALRHKIDMLRQAFAVLQA